MEITKIKTGGIVGFAQKKEQINLKQICVHYF